MLSFPGSLKVWVALEPCDMRKGFGGLQTLVGERLGEDLRHGALFVFSNRRHNRLKILYWDGTGLWVIAQAVGAGVFFVAAQRGAWAGEVEADTGGAGDVDGRDRHARDEDAPVV